MGLDSDFYENHPESLLSVPFFITSFTQQI